MNPNERQLVVAGLDTVSNLVDEVNQTAPQNKSFVEISKAALALARGLVNAGHTDPAAELRRLCASIEGAWQDSLDEKFKQT
jgi:hypothetical protein